jgi:hypothetical protein
MIFRIRISSERRAFPTVWLFIAISVCAGLPVLQLGGAPQTAKEFNSPQEAAEALVSAAETYDVGAIEQILGPQAHDIIATGNEARDREQATAFASQARTKMRVVIDPKNANLATLNAGDEDWPLPIPIVRKAGKWSYHTATGRKEILFRRIGENESTVIEIARGFVEAQHEYALQKHGGVNQYAQHIISTPGTEDGLAWRRADGTWDGPVGEVAARAIQQGYTDVAEPFHGYFFKVLKGQGPAAPLGEMDFVVKGVMIGGFAMVAAPAQYRVTGVKTFIVSHDGVVYEEDLGPNTLDLLRKMERFNPDKTWKPVED